MSVIVVALLLLAGATALSLNTGPYTPAPAHARLRGVVTGLAVAAAGLLFVSGGSTWWVQSDAELPISPDEPSGIEHGEALTAVLAGGATAAMAAAAAWGRRNWAPLGVVVMWLALGYGWLIASGGMFSSRLYGEPRAGLRLATVAAVVLTLATVTALVHRSLSSRSQRNSYRALTEPRQSTYERRAR